MTEQYHLDVLNRVHGGFMRGLTPFRPLTPEEYHSLTATDILSDLNYQALKRMWLDPVQMFLQQHYRIDQRIYSTTSVPTLAELTEDFQVAATLMVDKLALNPEDVTGVETAGGSSRAWDNLVPLRAQAILYRYARLGGGVTRG